MKLHFLFSGPRQKRTPNKSFQVGKGSSHMIQCKDANKGEKRIQLTVWLSPAWCKISHQNPWARWFWAHCLLMVVENFPIGSPKTFKPDWKVSADLIGKFPITRSKSFRWPDRKVIWFCGKSSDLNGVTLLGLYEGHFIQRSPSNLKYHHQFLHLYFHNTWSFYLRTFSIKWRCWCIVG